MNGLRHGRRLLGVVLAGAGAILVAAALVVSCVPGSGRGGSGVAAAAATSAPPDAGDHAGHGATFSAPPAAPLRPGERFVTVTMPRPYTPVAPNGGTDEYRCFLVDPGLTQPAYLTGSQFLPQNAAIVHHAIFFRVGPEAAARARAAGSGTGGDGWTCFGDAGIGADAAWVAAWAPGANETLLAPGLGYPMPAGSVLVMQVHYNLLATRGRPGGSDQSGIRLRLSDGSSRLTPLQTMLLPGPVELPCAAGESGPLCDRAAAVADVRQRFGAQVGATEDALNAMCHHGAVTPGPTQSCDQPVRRAGTVYALAGHMHLLGRSIRIELNPGTARARTLLDVPVYDFDNQALRALPQPVAVRAGDVLRVTCTHDAGLRRMLPALRDTPPRYVVWGDGTSDEMCLGLVVWSTGA
jgi:Copper type II ascorbate-dependent monooxygenase, C-terminal domain